LKGDRSPVHPFA